MKDSELLLSASARLEKDNDQCVGPPKKADNHDKRPPINANHSLKRLSTKTTKSDVMCPALKDSELLPSASARLEKDNGMCPALKASELRSSSSTELEKDNDKCYPKMNQLFPWCRLHQKNFLKML